MEEKTISYLNKKVWYRTLKVLYILFFLLILFIYNFIVFREEFKNVDLNKTQITCNYGNKKTFSPRDVNISLRRYDFENETFDYKYYFESYNNYNIEKILSVCSNKDIDTSDIFPIQRYYELGLNKIPVGETAPAEKMNEIIQIKNAILDSDKAKFLDYSVKLFDIEPMFTYARFIKLFIMGNLMIVLIFEVLRRIFYYIVLGKILPRKKYNNDA